MHGPKERRRRGISQFQPIAGVIILLMYPVLKLQAQRCRNLEGFYISDPTTSVTTSVRDTAQGIIELPDSHGFNLGDFWGLLGLWERGCFSRVQLWSLNPFYFF